MIPHRLPQTCLRLVHVLALSAVFVLSSLLAHAATDKKSFDVPAGVAPASLKQFAEQAGGHVLYSVDDVTGVKTLAVKGEFTPREALNRMLAGTTLYIDSDPQTEALTVRKETEVEAKNVSRAIAEGSKSARPEKSSRSDEGADGEKVVKLDTFEVFGRKTLNMDIQRTRDDVQPYVVFDKNVLADSGVTNLEDFLKYRLPMNTMSTSINTSSSGQFGNVSSLNLRGFGTNQTLILVDGRKLPSINNSGVFVQSDFNAIPMSAIARVEVLPSSASAIYGGGATGGVLNIILKRNYNRITVSANYGNTFSSDAGLYQVDLSAGFTLNGERTRVLLTATHSDGNDILVANRNFARRARDLLMKNNPSSVLNSVGLPQGYLPNIRSSDGSNLVLNSGTVLNSPITFVPIGYAGVSADGGAALVANAGRYSLDIPDDLTGAKMNLRNTPTITSWLANVRHEFGKNLEGYVDAGVLENKSFMYGSNGNTNFVTLPRNTPNNPFTTSINVLFPVTSISLPWYSVSKTTKAAGGLILRLPSDWKVMADYSWSKSRFQSRASNPVLTTPGLAALASGTLDVVRDLNQFPIDYTSYLLKQGNSVQGPGITSLREASLRAAGSVWGMPGGDAALSVLLQRRDETAKEFFSDFGNRNGSTLYNYVPEKRQSVKSAYGELRLPVFGKTHSSNWAKQLELQYAMRADAYETYSTNPQSAFVSNTTSRDNARAAAPAFAPRVNAVTAITHTAGVLYAPLEDLFLRASVATGFLPPATNQLQKGVPQTFTESLVDPLRGGIPTTISYQRTSGGNPELEPEDSKTLSLGLVLTPRFIPGLRLAVDYTKIEKRDEIASLTTQQFVDFEKLLPGRVTRATLTAADAGLGYTGGVISAIDTSSVNLARKEVEAYDVSADYGFNVSGKVDIKLYGIATWQPEFAAQPVPNVAWVNSAGYSGGPLKRRGNAGATISAGSWTGGVNIQFFDKYLIYSATAIPSQIATAVLSQGSEFVRSQHYTDVFVRYNFSGGDSKLSWLTRGVSLQVTVQDLFNTEPPLVAGIGAAGGYSGYGDARLRRFSITFRKEFSR